MATLHSMIWCIGRTKGAHYSLMSGMKKNGCYSGSGITTEDKYFLFYTGNVRDAEGGRETYQCVAVSDDGKSFQKEGPVIYLPDGYTAHFRDPKVWKKNNSWWMVVGAQTKELQGNVALFESNNLKKWDYRGKSARSVNGLGIYVRMSGYSGYRRTTIFNSQLSKRNWV